MLESTLQKYANANVFCFGNPIPDLRFCIKNLTLQNWTVYSDVCPIAPFWDQTVGVWIDYFNGNPDFNLIRSFLKTKKVCLVCEDLYNRSNIPFLEHLNQYGLWGHPHLILCTNVPLEISKKGIIPS